MFLAQTRNHLGFGDLSFDTFLYRCPKHPQLLFVIQLVWSKEYRRRNVETLAETCDVFACQLALSRQDKRNSGLAAEFRRNVAL